MPSLFRLALQAVDWPGKTRLHRALFFVLFITALALCGSGGGAVLPPARLTPEIPSSRQQVAQQSAAKGTPVILVSG